MSKYDPLWNFIKDNKKEDFSLTFDEIEQILNFPIDHSFLTYKKECLSIGFKVKKISMKERKVYFNKRHDVIFIYNIKTTER